MRNENDRMKHHETAQTIWLRAHPIKTVEDYDAEVLEPQRRKLALKQLAEGTQ